MIALLYSLSCTSEPPPDQPDLVLVSWDTVRDDHFGAHTAPIASAMGGTRFTTARSPVALTLPAHASMLSGEGPPVHGARLNGVFEVSEQVPMVQEALQAGGYATAAFVSASVLTANYGLGRGFEAYQDGMTVDGVRQSSLDGALTVERAEAWMLEAPDDRPWFIWLHLYDPHRPWDGPRGSTYEDEIRYADELTGRLLEALDARGREGRRVVLLTSDHGEGLGEHDEPTHGHFVYDATLRVPLVLSSDHPDWPTPGRELAAPVRLQDLAPTLAEAGGVPFPEVEGRSLWPLIRGGTQEARPMAVESVMAAGSFAASPLFGVVTPEEELWVEAPRRERYDMRQDPGQTHDLYTAQDALRADQLFAAHPRAWPPEAIRSVDDGVQQQLEALGYMGAPEASWPDLGLDPKDLVDLSNLSLDQWAVLKEVELEHRLQVYELVFDPPFPSATLRELPALVERYPELEALGQARARSFAALGSADCSPPPGPGPQDRFGAAVLEGRVDEALAIVASAQPCIEARLLFAERNELRAEALKSCPDGSLGFRERAALEAQGRRSNQSPP